MICKYIFQFVLWCKKIYVLWKMQVNKVNKYQTCRSLDPTCFYNCLLSLLLNEKDINRKYYVVKLYPEKILEWNLNVSCLVGIIRRAFFSKFTDQRWDCSSCWQRTSFFNWIFTSPNLAIIPLVISVKSYYYWRVTYFIWLNNEITATHKLSALCIFCQQSLIVLLKPPLAYTNSLASLHCLKAPTFWKSFVFIPDAAQIHSPNKKAVYNLVIACAKPVFNKVDSSLLIFFSRDSVLIIFFKIWASKLLNLLLNNYIQILPIVTSKMYLYTS